MDVLSEVLKLVHLEGAFFFNAEFSAPWCLLEPQTRELIPHVAPGSRHLILFHLLTDGQAYAKLPTGKRVDLDAGDIVVLPHGDAHVLGAGTGAKPVETVTTFAKSAAEGLKLVQFGGGGKVTRLVCGFMACEPQLSEVFLAGLPPIFKVHVGEEASGQWLTHSIRFSVNEWSEARSGAGLILSRLAELLFVETLRRYISAMPKGETGWLAGTRDPVLGRALTLIHQEPANEWTMETLARRAGLSRSRLAERFRHFLGKSPMAYVAQWRLKLGAELLLSGELSVAEIAAEVGYGSESAFNRAFRREYDFPPAQYRRNARDS